ncbi:uncharacterized protein LOC126889272 [Diabrotica virgifera virgifera]|uniref:Uncharacterized protein n=2 Tax=Diabrotica virgifera virgifera TaxID=50390 RepID=A0ABM5KT27_DIAVI|nr:uncharacterized protein LOC126889272 [Diabrotica virgifera virgifera]
MKLVLWLLALSGYIIVVQCHLHTIVANPGGIGGIYKGPDSETIVKGPDGSVITSQEKGGLIATEQKLEPIVAAEPAVLEVAQPIGPEYIEDGHVIPLGYSETVIGPAGPSLVEDGYIGPIVQSNPVSPTLVAPLEPFIPGTVAPPIQSVTPFLTTRRLDIQGTVAPPLAPSVHLVAPPPHLHPIPPVVPVAPVVQPVVPVVAPAVPVGHKVDIVEQDPHIIETKIIDAPAIEPKESTDLVGPSGSISTRGSESVVSGPASTTITKTAKVIVTPPVIAVSGIRPVVAPVVPPVHFPPLVEINHELPLASNGPIIGPSVGPIVSSTISPPIISSTVSPLSVSTVAPPIIGPVVSTLGPPLHKYEGPRIAAARPIHVVPGSTISHPQVPVFATGLLTGEEFEGVRPSDIPHIPVHSSTVAPHPGQVVLATATPGIVVEDEGASGFIHPGGAYPGVLSSTLIPVTSTISPLSYDQQHINGHFGGQIQPQNVIRPGIHSITLVPVSPTIAPHGYNGPLSGPIQPQNNISPGVHSSTLVPVPTNVAPHNYNQQHIHGHFDGQIPNQNIIPPEIGIHRQVGDVNGPKAPGLINPPSLQGIDNDNIQRVDVEPTILEHNIQNGYYHNEYLVGNTENDYNFNRPLLSNTNPIQNSHQAPVAPPSQVDVAVLSARADSQHDYEDRASASLWNRYGRKTRNRKY